MGGAPAPSPTFADRRRCGATPREPSCTRVRTIQFCFVLTVSCAISIDDVLLHSNQIKSKSKSKSKSKKNLRLVCKKRFSEFEALHKALTKRFRWFAFPPFPEKKMNGFSFLKVSLTERELIERYETKHCPTRHLVHRRLCWVYNDPFIIGVLRTAPSVSPLGAR